VWLAGSSLVCCVEAVPAPQPARKPWVPDPIDAAAAPGEAPPASAIADAAVESQEATALAPPDDPMELHLESGDALRALMGAAASVSIPVGGGPFRLGQGNRAISHHSIGRRACLEGLRDLTTQSDEQRAQCGAEGMVPVWDHGGPASARFCIDVFEFPNKACELPFVFVSPAQADRICRAQGKRLCSQQEWSLACRGDPEGGADRLYAYGDELDLTICNTNKSRAEGPTCDVSSQTRLWNTCGTNTEPSGAFPRCRSRFGVFDMHGNVAEIMARFEPADGHLYTQLKGSAFFYVDVAKRPSEGGGYWTKYPDHCNFDPRWHVERLETSQHMNYHLGFRCCRTTVEPAAQKD
jgi:formylglycine-generating enzyme